MSVSELAPLLSRRLAPGVYTWRQPAGPEEVRAVAGHAGWRAAWVAGEPDRAGVLDAIASGLDLPDWFGRNYDALVDALADVRGEPGTLVLWTGWAGLAEADPEAFATVVAILQERSADEPALATLLCGPGPEVGVPGLG